MSQAQTIPQTIPQTITFDEFAAWYPENSIRRYELHNGVIVEMPLAGLKQKIRLKYVIMLA